MDVCGCNTFCFTTAGRRCNRAATAGCFTHRIDAITQRPERNQSTPHDALAAVKAFRDELALRGIRLIVVPVPK